MTRVAVTRVANGRARAARTGWMRVPKGKGRPSDGMRKDALGGRIDHAMAWAFTVKEHGRFVGEGICKAIARGDLANAQRCSGGVFASLLLDGFGGHRWSATSHYKLSEGRRQDSPALPSAKAGFSGLGSPSAADAMEPEERKTGAEESQPDVPYLPAFTRKCLGVQFAVLGLAPASIKVLKVGEGSPKEHDFVLIRW